MCLLINLLPMIQNKAFHSRQALPKWRPFKETLCMAPCLAYNVKTMLVMSGRISQWVILFRFSPIQQLRAPVRNVLLIWGDLYVGVFKEIACIITNRVLPNVAEVYLKKKKTKKAVPKDQKGTHGQYVEGIWPSSTLDCEFQHIFTDRKEIPDTFVAR